MLEFPFALFFISIIYMWVLPPIIHMSPIFPPWHFFLCFCMHLRLWFSLWSLSPLCTAGIKRTKLSRRHHKPRQWIQQRENSFRLTAGTECISSAPGWVLEDWTNCAPIRWNYINVTISLSKPAIKKDCLLFHLEIYVIGMMCISNAMKSCK